MSSQNPQGKKSTAPEPFVPDFSEGLETGLYLALLELIDEGLIITGDEVVLEANSAACRLLERDYRQIAGKPLADLFPSERAFLNARQRLLIQGEMRGSLQVALPGGRLRTLRFIAAARLRPGIHALIISEDLLAEARDDEIEHSDSLWPRLAGALEQPVIVIDGANRVAAANAAALRALKVKRDQLVGQRIDSVFEIQWPAPGTALMARLRLCGQKKEILARVLSGPRPDWQVLVLPAGHARPEHSGDIAANHSDLAGAVSRAFERNELEVYFQPLIDARDGRVRSGEALLRWNHPELGRIPFSEFMDIARDCNLLGRMGDWALDAALAQAAEWPASDCGLPGLTVNIATEQLIEEDSDLLERVRASLQRSGIAPHRLELDFDEQVLNEDGTRLIGTLAAISDLGVRLAIDDFGRGAVSIRGLKRYPIGAIKLSPALVRDVGTREDSEAIVEAISSMAEVLGLQVLARGVETREQRAFLAALGCHLQQGPLFGQPLSPPAFREMLVSRRTFDNQ